MNYEEALDYIHSLGKFGLKPGLERIEKMLSLMGNPHKGLKFIHVAGTNGKGSTSVYIANVLYKAGFNVGLYTSPYVTEFNERITFNSDFISDDDLAVYTDYTASLARKVFTDEHPITEFEFITALAFKYYADKKCDVVVLEVGLGGRLDATNVIEKPLASVITKIDLDHTGILGDTVEQIAAEKCGIIKKGCPVITTSQNEPKVLKVIKRFAKDNDSQLYLNKSQNAKIISSDIYGNVFKFGFKKYRTRMPGVHQVDNALTALKVIKTVFPKIRSCHIYEGIRKAGLAARCELMSYDPTDRIVLLDGSHNPNGVEALENLLCQSNINNAVGIAGFMADKDVSKALQKILKRFNKIYTVTVASNPRTMSAVDLAKLCRDLGADAEAADDYLSAINKAKALNGPIIVFGSLYLAGDIRPLL